MILYHLLRRKRADSIPWTKQVDLLHQIEYPLRAQKMRAREVCDEKTTFSIELMDHSH